MQKETFDNKVALILGADTVLGRAVALQLSRVGCTVILAGDDESGLEKVANIIVDKGGSPHGILLDKSPKECSLAIRERRDLLGHIHIAVNALAFDDQDPIRRADALNTVLFDLTKGRGAARFATIWPMDEPAPPSITGDFWHTLVRIGGIDSGAEGDGLKAAAVADAVVSLLRCPAGACPAEVRMEPRKVKA